MFCIWLLSSAFAFLLFIFSSLFRNKDRPVHDIWNASYYITGCSSTVWHIMERETTQYTTKLKREKHMRPMEYYTVINEAFWVHLLLSFCLFIHVPPLVEMSVSRIRILSSMEVTHYWHSHKKWSWHNTENISSLEVIATKDKKNINDTF